MATRAMSSAAWLAITKVERASHMEPYPVSYPQQLKVGLNGMVQTTAGGDIFHPQCLSLILLFAGHADDCASITSLIFFCNVCPKPGGNFGDVVLVHDSRSSSSSSESAERTALGIFLRFFSILCLSFAWSWNVLLPVRNAVVILLMSFESLLTCRSVNEKSAIFFLN